MVAVAFGVLVIALLGAAGLAKQSASNAAKRDLEDQAPSIAKELEEIGPLFRRAFATNRNPATVQRACRLIDSTLRISGGGVVSVTADGTVEEGLGGLLGAACASTTTLPQLPTGVEVDDLDVDALDGGLTQTAVVGDTAFVAQPLSRLGAVRPVLVLTQDVDDSPLGRAGGFLLATGALALLAAVVVSAWLARRLTRPIAAMEVTANAIASGDLSARVGDVTGPDDELAALARSIDSMADELETARGHERAFLLNVSHDLRTPLTSIKGYAEALTDGTAVDPDARARAAGVITAEARRLERLVADLLDLARLDAHQFSLRPVETDARAVVSATVEGFAPAASEWKVQLRVAPGDAVTATVDPERLAQIVANLVENALKYASSVVVVDVARIDGVLQVRVDDDGPGIPDEDRPRVFERLYTGRATAGRKVGTGIGLAIVHELAAAMGGTAAVAPLAPAGTRFVVTLP
jgi:two-component system sensor histidine kinase BaeS